MSFQYQKRSSDELEQIAEIVLRRYDHRRSGFIVDVEGIIDDCELTLLLRRGGLNKYCEGYVAQNPHYIVLPEAYASYQPRYRAILAEELCHVILEYDMLNTGGKLPDDAQPHTLTPEQHEDIETNADYLALAVLFPKKTFTDRFNFHCENVPATFKATRDKFLIHVTEGLEADFQVWTLKVAYRARDLGLISAQECRSCFSDRIAM